MRKRCIMSRVNWRKGVGTELSFWVERGAAT